jgi:signal peptidase I
LSASAHIHHAGPATLVQSLARIVVVALFILTFIAQPFRIPSASMEPTLLVGDFLLVNRQALAPAGAWRWLLPYRDVRRGDVLVFRYPVDPSMHLVKRAIALPGDHLRLSDGRAVINGHALDEPYTQFTSSGSDGYRDGFPRLESAVPGVETRWWIQMRSLVTDGELGIPPGGYFVMGDNRNDSQDSRYWGLVPRTAIEGTPLFIYLSLASPRAQADGARTHVRWPRVLQLVR